MANTYSDFRVVCRLGGFTVTALLKTVLTSSTNLPQLTTRDFTPKDITEAVVCAPLACLS